MTLKFKAEEYPPQASNNEKFPQNVTQEKILCPHCRRTATNGVKCKGICVAESDY